MKAFVTFEFKDETMPKGKDSVEFELTFSKNTNFDLLENIKIVVPVMMTTTFEVKKTD